MFRTDTGYAADMPDREEFLGCLRAALAHLHEPDRLRQNPLAAAFGTRDRFSSSRRLYSILVDAIAELEPHSNSTSTPNAQDTYEILFYRFVQQIPPKEVADQLGVGVRHLRRKQRLALESLADLLLAKADLRKQLRAWGASPKDPQQEHDTDSVESELAWLTDPEVEHRADPKAVLSDVLKMLQPMADGRRCHLRARCAEHIPEVIANPTALRQILLDILGVAINASTGRYTEVDMRAAQWAVAIEVTSSEERGDQRQVMAEDGRSLYVASRLALMSGGKLELGEKENQSQARLVLPTFEGSSVLVVDDNADFLQLIRRYLSGTRYHVVTTSQPEDALAMAVQTQPRIIVLDVMMPGIDGWELLRQFRQNDAVCHIPIVVCTIVGSDDLAHSLGASSYLKKPVTREDLLASLDQQVRETEQEDSVRS